MQYDSLGDRMKQFEFASRTKLPIRMPIILRSDGKSFHNYTKGCKRPYDEALMEAMDQVALKMCSSIQGAQLGYVQSDEISIFIHSYKKFNSAGWFDHQVQKMVSVSASIAAGVMTEESIKVFGKVKRAEFDSRVFVVPEREVANALIWRQQDWSRNSIQMLARSHFSNKELFRKDQSDIHEMLHNIGINWNDLSTRLKRGRCIRKIDNKWEIDNNIPIFSQDRNYIEQYLVCEDE